jgi:hypothetical protein
MTRAGAATRDEAGTALDAARAFAVAFGGSVVAVTGAAAAVAGVVRALARGRRPPWWASLGALATIGYAAGVVPWVRSWGATGDERSGALPGDELEPDPAFSTTRAVSVAAPPSEVWPWLAQIGQDRGGFYSYEWLENLAGCRLRNAHAIHQEWQHRRVGDTVMLHPAKGLPVSVFEPGRAFGIEGWGVYALEPAEGGRSTRLLARSRIGRAVPAVFYTVLVEFPHFVMERKMLLGIKSRAERAAGTPAGGTEDGA